MIRKTVIITAVLIFTLTTLSFAQLPGGKWWKLEKIAKAVDMSPEQVKKIEKLFLEQKKRMIDAKAEVDKGKLDLDAMFAEDEFNKAAVTGEIEKMVAARGELMKIKMMFFVDIRDILTKEQFSKLRDKKREFREYRREKRGMRRGGDKSDRMDKMERMKKKRDMMQSEAPCPDPPCRDDVFMDDEY